MNFLAGTKEMHYNFSRQHSLKVAVLSYEYCHDNDINFLSDIVLFKFVVMHKRLFHRL